MDGRFEGRTGRSSRSLLAVPLAAGDRVLGALSLVRRAPATPFSDDDLVLVATIGNYTGVALDNARRSQEERALVERLAELDRLSAEQRATVAELERNNRQCASVVSTVSHELRSPLFGIQGFAQLMMDGHASADDVRDFATEIHDNAVRLAQYVERILSEDALHHGQVTLNLGEVSLRPLVDGVLRAAATAAREAHRLLNDVPDDLPPVWGDADRIVQILQNLVGNAVKYSPGGGRVAVSARVAGRMVEVVVEDEGIGVPPADRSRIFERFTRVTSPQTRAIGGAGIGLAVVRGLVELHGGRVWVDEAPVRGSRFHVELPVAVPSPPVTAPLFEVA
jgi:signal transduction histidine kinase